MATVSKMDKEDKICDSHQSLGEVGHAMHGVMSATALCTGHIDLKISHRETRRPYMK